ncbi:MAG TPA: PhpK family radical SAM P-methyltransferase [Candidatus Ozemobacteraceae bacterium]|nr:PhpK family radical SAM P-methyltransferase [Candidatus Ozemobacteraceae bacterium]
MTDCIFIGFNDVTFSAQVEAARSMSGIDSGVYRDMRLAFVEKDGVPRRALELMTDFHYGDRPVERPFHNMDFFIPTLIYLGTYLHRRGLSFEYVNLFQREKDRLRHLLREKKPLTVAITTTFYVTPQPILEIIPFIREHAPQATIVVGGPFINNQAAAMDEEALTELFAYLGADAYVISTEGEFALVEIIKAVKAGKTLEGISNVAWRRGDRFVINERTMERNGLEENMPDYTLFPPERYGRFVSLRTAKSCPFRCAYCGFPQRAGQYHYIDVDMVERELDAVAAIGGIDTVTILDDTFNVPKKRFREILEMMIRKRYGFRWNSFYRCDHGDEEIIGLMREAGCEGVFLGAESANDGQLERMNKTSRRADYERAVAALTSAGIITHLGYIIGFPGETHASAAETARFIDESGADFFRAQIWYCDPITPIFKEREKYRITGSAFNWSHATMNSREASDIVDNIFLTARNAIWMPQYGYELWSVFYLMRRGMTLAQVKTYMSLFLGAVKEGLLFPGAPVTAETMAALATSCRFDRPDVPDPAVVDRYKGENVGAALAYWRRRIASMSSGALPETAPGELSEVRPLRADLAERLLNTFGGRPEAALATGLALAAAGQETPVVVSDAGNPGIALPVLAGGGGDRFDTMVANVSRQLAEGQPHRVGAVREMVEASGNRFPLFVSVGDAPPPAAIAGQVRIWLSLSNGPARWSIRSVPSAAAEAGRIGTVLEEILPGLLDGEALKPLQTVSATGDDADQMFRF